MIARSFTLDGQEGVRNPVGLHGFRLDVEAHIITGAISSIQNLAKCLEQVGVRVENLVLEPLASAEAVLSDDEKEAGVVLVDIGGGTSDIAVFVGGSVCFTGVIPVGGYQFTQDLVIGLRTPQVAAEEAKIRQGSVETVDIPPDDLIELSMFGPGEKRQVPHRLMNEILRARATELIELVQSALRHSGYEGLVPAGVVLTGGAANLRHLNTLAEEILHTPIRIGVPDGITGLTDTVSGSAYATGIGLLLWGQRYESGGEPEPLQQGFDFGAMLKNLFGFLKGRWAEARN